MKLKMLRLKQFERQKIQTCRRQLNTVLQILTATMDTTAVNHKFEFFWLCQVLVIFSFSILNKVLSLSVFLLEKYKQLHRLHAYMYIGKKRPMDTHQSLQQQNQAVFIRKVVNISHFSLINIDFTQLDHISSYHVSLVKVIFQFWIETKLIKTSGS